MSVPERQNFRLTWLNYSQKLTESFHKFLISETLCNVTLCVHNKNVSNSIKAHQAILSACSPWFETILSETQHPHPIIILKDVRFQDLKSIIRFIYTGEVFVPQHELQGFLRTAELLEIKGLLKDVNDLPVNLAPPVLPENIHEVQDGNISPPILNEGLSKLSLPLLDSPDSHNMSDTQPVLTSAPLSTILFSNFSENDQLYDIVSEIKNPVAMSSDTDMKDTLDLHLSSMTHQIASGRKRKLELRKIRTHSTSKTFLSSSQYDVSNIGNPLLPQSAIEEDGVSWIDDSVDQIESTSINNQSCLKPEEWVSTGVSDCGSFKRSWAERYLCYNLGREIICLICFCRFTQFKKFNLERHMKNKHVNIFNLPENERRNVLERYLGRYVDHLTSIAERKGDFVYENVTSEIVSFGTIQHEDLSRCDEEVSLPTNMVVKEEVGSDEGNFQQPGCSSDGFIAVGNVTEADAEILVAK